VLIGVDDDDALVADLTARQVPLVGVDVRCTGRRTAYVGSDHAGGVRLALAHLHALGHRRIAHLAGAPNTVAGSERSVAFRREAEALGLDASDELVRPATSPRRRATARPARSWRSQSGRRQSSPRRI
jgi:LacI family transcriptional regulator